MNSDSRECEMDHGSGQLLTLHHSSDINGMHSDAVPHIRNGQQQALQQYPDDKQAIQQRDVMQEVLSDDDTHSDESQQRVTHQLKNLQNQEMHQEGNQKPHNTLQEPSDGSQDTNQDGNRKHQDTLLELNQQVSEELGTHAANPHSVSASAAQMEKFSTITSQDVKDTDTEHMNGINYPPFRGKRKRQRRLMRTELEARIKNASFKIPLQDMLQLLNRLDDPRTCSAASQLQFFEFHESTSFKELSQLSKNTLNLIATVREKPVSRHGQLVTAARLATDAPPEHKLVALSQQQMLERRQRNLERSTKSPSSMQLHNDGFIQHGESPQLQHRNQEEAPVDTIEQGTNETTRHDSPSTMGHHASSSENMTNLARSNDTHTVGADAGTTSHVPREPMNQFRTELNSKSRDEYEINNSDMMHHIQDDGPASQEGGDPKRARAMHNSDSLSDKGEMTLALDRTGDTGTAHRIGLHDINDTLRTLVSLYQDVKVELRDPHWSAYRSENEDRMNVLRFELLRWEQNLLDELSLQ